VAELSIESGYDLAGEAMHHIERALQLGDNNVEASFNHAQLLQVAGRDMEAIGEYGRVLTRKPDLAATHFGLGSALADEGRLEEAIGEFREALRLKPHDADAKRNLGVGLDELPKDTASDAFDQIYPSETVKTVFSDQAQSAGRRSVVVAVSAVATASGATQRHPVQTISILSPRHP